MSRKEIETKPPVEIELVEPADEALARLKDWKGPIDAESLYYAEAGLHDILTWEQEEALFEKIERGRAATSELEDENIDPERKSLLELWVAEGNRAGHEVIEKNQRLVMSIARRYTGQGVPFLDLVQQGNLGLHRAVNGFELDRGNQFSTYAFWWIRQEISRSVHMQGRTIRLPVHVAERVTKVIKAKEDLVRETGRQPTVREIAEDLDLKTHQVERALKDSQPLTSLDLPVGDEGDSTLADFIEDEQVVDPEKETERRDLSREVAKAMRTLDPRERQILELRFGLEDGRARTLEEVGGIIGVTRERIRQIEEKALRKLRHPMPARRLRDFT